MRKTTMERNEFFVQDFPHFFKLNNQIFEMFKTCKRVLLSTRKCFEQRLMVVRNDFDSKFTGFRLFQKAGILVTYDLFFVGVQAFDGILVH